MSSRSREGSRPPCGWPIWAGRHEPIRASARPARCLAPSATRTLTSGTRSTCAASSKTPKAKPGLIPASRLPSSGRAGPPSRWPSATRPSAIAPAGHYGQQHRLVPLPAGKRPAGADPVPPGQSPGTRSLATRVDQPRPAPGTARLHPSPARRLRRSRKLPAQGGQPVRRIRRSARPGPGSGPSQCRPARGRPARACPRLLAAGGGHPGRPAASGR